MIKAFCDVCGKEDSEENVGKTLCKELGKVKVQIFPALDGEWIGLGKGKHICESCVLEVINKGNSIPGIGGVRKPYVRKVKT